MDRIMLTIDQLKSKPKQNILICESLDEDGCFDLEERLDVDSTLYPDSGVYDTKNDFLYWYSEYGNTWIAYK